ncbi:MAG: GNAT family N-acetyltransferase [Sphaerochaetaceae bacterium]|nr:GNAT family N-acetyltransferase [Sphaerochaetaceae bacterium]
MNIRHAEYKDIDKILEVYDIARKTMRKAGNLNQWINGYPQKELIEEDISNSNCYVVEDNNEIVAVLAFIIGDDPTYHEIEGSWLNDKPYGVIHRIGSNGKVKGIIPFVMDYAFKIVDNLKIDTHKDNAIMQHVLEKNGFKYCGIVTIEDGTKRIAFQRSSI